MCARCGEAILPAEPWDLDYRDDLGGFRGLAYCIDEASSGGSLSGAAPAASLPRRQIGSRTGARSRARPVAGSRRMTAWSRAQLGR
jgi:hypothetical protein